MKKRILVFLLTLLFTAALLPWSAVPARAETLSGSCGGVSWSLNTGTGELKISGSGRMTDWVDPYDVPWDNERDSIQTVTIASGVKNVGDWAFFACYSLTSVSIPSTVTEIGEEAFASCENLGSISLPSGLTEIGECAFEHCNQFTAITIPAATSVIGDQAFYCCKNLTKITVASGNANYSSDSSGVLFNKNKTVLIQAPGALPGSYSIPTTAAKLMWGAFTDCDHLTAVTIPAGTAEIENYVFADCSALKTITVASGNPSYSNDGKGVLFNKSKDTLIQCPAGLQGTYTVPGTVRTISCGAFEECEKLTGITVPSGVLKIDEFAFYGCIGLTGMTIPSTVTMLEPYAFSECTGLKTVTVPGSIENVGECAFEGCTGLTAVTFSAGVEEIEYGAFRYCTALKTLTIPASLHRIGEEAFLDCAALSGVTIPSTVTLIEDYALGYSEPYSEEKFSGFVIRGTAGSAAAAYAADFGLVFEDTSVAKPKITAQPKSASVPLGGTTTFKVTASGTGLKYQWQFRKAGTSTWYNWAGKTSASLPVTGSATNNQCQYRCVVSNAGGHVNSAAVTLTVTEAVAKPSITSQPKSATVALGSTATFKVTASGTGLKYQWQFRKAGTSTWYDWAGKTSASLPVTGSATNNQCQYRCVVSNSAGHVNSAAVTLTVTGASGKPEITAQPAAAKVTLDTTVVFKVVAAGSNLSYQWQFSKNNGGTWYDWSGKTASTLSVKASTTNNGCLYRCVVKNSNGSATSSSARLTVSNIAPTIVVQPEDVTAAIGQKTAMKVVAAGSGLSYQWYYCKTGDGNWIKWSGKTAYKLEITASATNDGCMYRCVVTNPYGSVWSWSAEMIVIW